MGFYSERSYERDVYKKLNFLALRVPEIIGGIPKWAVPGYTHAPLSPIRNRRLVTLPYAPFRSYGSFYVLLAHPYSTLTLGCSRCTRSPMLGVNEHIWALSYSAVKLFSKNSNLSDND